MGTSLFSMEQALDGKLVLTVNTTESIRLYMVKPSGRRLYYLGSKKKDGSYEFASCAEDKADTFVPFNGVVTLHNFPEPIFGYFKVEDLKIEPYPKADQIFL